MAIQITTLENGLRIATDSMQEAESVVCGVWVDVGTRDEPRHANGIAHLVEHMMFKGTKKRSAFDLSEAIENRGGSMNAHTSREETAYYARMLPDDAPLALDIIADMLQRSVFAPKELAREKQVIIQEIGRDIDSPEDHIFDLVNRIAFPGQKIGRPILGTADVIAGMKRDDVVGYVNHHYNAANMVVVGSGRIDHKKFVELVRQKFKNLPAGKPRPKRTAGKSKAAHIYTPRDIEQLHVLFAFPSPGYKNAQNYSALILSVLLGGSASSRLFQEVREKLGLAYSVSAAQVAMSDCGLFQIYAGTDPIRAKELIPVLCRELKKAQHIKGAEFDRAKTQIRADLLMGRESVMRRAETLGHHMLAYGKPISLSQILTKLDAVTPKDAEKFAAQLVARPPIVLALGPTGQVESYAAIRKRMAQ